LSLLLTRLTIGLTVSIGVGVAAEFFKGRLIRRKASWQLFRRAFADDGSAK
jgi:hypothetical protein